MNASGIKKNAARLILKGISILGILFGISCVFVTVMMLYSIPKDDIFILSVWLITLGAVLVFGVYLVYASYLMFRWKSFGVIKVFFVLLALDVFSSVVGPLNDFAVKWVSGIEARTVVGLASCTAALLLAVLVYLICVKLFERLLKAANSSEKISENELVIKRP